MQQELARLQQKIPFETIEMNHLHDLLEILEQEIQQDKIT